MFISVPRGILIHPAVSPQHTWAKDSVGCALFSWESWVPIKHKVGWAEAYLHTKWHLNPSSRLATTDIGHKLGGYAPLEERELGPHLTQCRLG